jgi:hypothetical protein
MCVLEALPELELVFVRGAHVGVELEWRAYVGEALP